MVRENERENMAATTFIFSEIPTSYLIEEINYLNILLNLIC